MRISKWLSFRWERANSTARERLANRNSFFKEQSMLKSNEICTLLIMFLFKEDNKFTAEYADSGVNHFLPKSLNSFKKH